MPNPEIPHFPVEPYLGGDGLRAGCNPNIPVADQIKKEMDAYGGLDRAGRLENGPCLAPRFQPHVIVGASKGHLEEARHPPLRAGGVYIIGLWRRGYWRGPSLLINAHPTLWQLRELPQDSNFALAVGSNDEVYPIRRGELEGLMNSGGMNKTFLYFTADSGRLPSGQISRQGDTHNQESLLHHDVLPRLIDSVLCPEGPEMHFIRTWKERPKETQRTPLAAKVECRAGCRWIATRRSCG